MKKLLLSCAIVGAALSASAQNNTVKFGVKAGATFPTITSKGEGESIKANTSFYVGGTVELPVSESFSVQSGLTFSGKGAKVSQRIPELGVDLEVKNRLWYLELPVNAVYSITAGTGKVFLGAGPYFGYALSGKNKVEGTMLEDGVKTQESVSEDVHFGDGGFKRADFGLNFLVGYQLNSGLNIHGGYGLGLSKLADIEGMGKNRVFSVGLGFSF